MCAPIAALKSPYITEKLAPTTRRQLSWRMLARFFLLSLSSMLPAVAADADRIRDSASPAPTRWINPLPLPNYPVGRISRDMPKGAALPASGLWLVDRAEQYRELADPTALWHEGKWYLYPSVDMAWVSADEGR